MEQVTAGQPTISLRFASDSCIDTSWNIWNKESGCRSLHRSIMASTLMSQNYSFLLTFRAFLFTLFFCVSPVILTTQLSSQFVFFRGSANIRWHLSLTKDLLCKMNERSWSFLLIVFIIDMYSELKSYISKHCCTLSHFSSVWLFATLWTVACQDSSVREIVQVRILQWIAIPFSRTASSPRDSAWVSCIASEFFTIWASKEADQSTIWCK